MAFYKEVDFSEEVRSLGRNGGEQVVIKETFKEVDVDQVPRAGGRVRCQGSGNHVEVRETKVEEDFNTRTGELTERREDIIFRSD